MSTVQKIKVERPKRKSETVYLVIQETECRETGAYREHVIGIYKHKDVAEFRANGAMLFAEQGNRDRVFVRAQEMVCEETPEDFLKNRL